MEPARIQSLWDDAQNTWNSWSYTPEEMYPIGVGSGENYSVGYRTRRWNHIAVYSTKFRRRERSSFITLRLFAPATAERNPVQEEQE